MYFYFVKFYIRLTHAFKKYDEEYCGIPGSSKGTVEAGLHGVRYIPPPVHHKSTTSLGSCSERRDSSVSKTITKSINDYTIKYYLETPFNFSFQVFNYIN